MSTVLPYSSFQTPVELKVNFGSYESFVANKPREVILRPADLIVEMKEIQRKCPQPEWWQIGGPGEMPSLAHHFASEKYRDLFREGQKREIYVGACEGLRWLSQNLKLPIYKLSTVKFKRGDERIGELGADDYAGEYFVDGQLVKDPFRFIKWFASHIYVRRPVAPNSCVTVGARALTVTLPESMTVEMFDAAFDFEIRKAAIDRFVMSEKGMSHCAAVGVDPTIAQRYTAYRIGAAVRHSPCNELAIFRIREQSDRLVNIAERIVLRHLGLVA